MCIRDRYSTGVGENSPVQNIHTREDTKMNILFFLKPKAEVAFVYDYHTLRQAMEIMEYHKYSSIPMINREGKYVGTITEGDLLLSLIHICII